MTSTPLRAAVYLRISLDRENTRLGVDRHREDAEALVKRRDWQPTEIYEDNDISGAGRSKRPAFEKLIADMKQGLIDVVVAQEWPRLERNRSEGVKVIETCQRHKVMLAFVKGSDIDTTTAAGRLVADLMSSMARNEIEVKGERQSRAHRQRAEQGRAPKGVRPLGYAINGVVLSDEANTVEKIYEAFAGGSSLRAIAAALSVGSSETISGITPIPRHMRTLMQERNERRVQDNKQRHADEQLELRSVPEDGPWPPSTVLGILRNPRYAGYSTYTPKEVHADGDRRRSWRSTILRDDAGEPVQAQWKPIVDELTWWRVQEILDNPERITNRAGTYRKHLGSGLFLCGVCHAPVKSHSMQYRCAGHVMRTRAHIDLFVTTAVHARLARPDLANLLPSTDEPRLQAIKEELIQHRAKIMRTQRNYDDELVEARDLKRVRDHEEAAIAVLEAERMRLGASTIAGGILGAEDPALAFTHADLGTQRSVIEALCEVRLLPHPRGVKGFNSDTVQISWT
jgi:site-specific DNA recombinase